MNEPERQTTVDLYDQTKAAMHFQLHTGNCGDFREASHKKTIWANEECALCQLVIGAT